MKIAQLANIAGSQNRISQPETPVTLQFQGNKFTLSPSQLRQLTTGQPLQLQGTLGNVHPVVTLFLNVIIFILSFVLLTCTFCYCMTFSKLLTSFLKITNHCDQFLDVLMKFECFFYSTAIY